jgi:cytochrome c oxidase subunit 2
MRRTIALLARCMGLGLVLACGTTMWGQSSPQRIEITAKRFGFTPGEITLKKGQPVILVLKDGDVAHGLRIRELNVDMKVKPGATTEFQFTPQKTGDFVGHCSVFCGSGHGSMSIKFHVVA